MPPTLAIKRDDFNHGTMTEPSDKTFSSSSSLSPSSTAKGTAHSTSHLAGRKHPSTPPPPSNSARSVHRPNATLLAHGIKLFKRNSLHREGDHKPMEWTNDWDNTHRTTNVTVSWADTPTHFTGDHRHGNIGGHSGGGSHATQSGGPKNHNFVDPSATKSTPHEREPVSDHKEQTSSLSKTAFGMQALAEASHSEPRRESHLQRWLSIVDDVDRDALNVCEFIEDRLYFMWTTTLPISTSRTTYLTIDKYLCYTPFCSDFGPFDIADVFRFCCLMKERMEIADAQGKVLCLHTKPVDSKRANAAFALCCYMMLLQNKTPDEAYAPIEYIHPPITPYRDAADGQTFYTLSILDCLRGLRKGLDLGLLRLDQFDVKEYEHYEKVVNGDFNWITPFFIAFAGPTDQMTRVQLMEYQAETARVAAKAAAEGVVVPMDEDSSSSADSSTATSSATSSTASTRSNTPSPIQSSAGSTRTSTPSMISTKTLHSANDCSLSFTLQASSIHGNNDSKVKSPSPLSSFFTDDNLDRSESNTTSGGSTEEKTVPERKKMRKRRMASKKRTHLKKSFQSLLDYFEHKAKVHTVIRLNVSSYDRNHFLARGIQHMDMTYPDGTNPPWSIVEMFLEVCEEVIQFKHGVVAVHCMAGLGRTGTLIAVYLMRHFDMTAREAIAFLRLMRPGSVVGPQQNWLAQNEWRLREMDAKLEERFFGKTETTTTATNTPSSASTPSLLSALQSPAMDFEQVFSRAHSAGLEPPTESIEGGSITVLDSDGSEESRSTASATIMAEENKSSDEATSSSAEELSDSITPDENWSKMFVAATEGNATSFTTATVGVDTIPVQPRKHDPSHRHNHHHHSDEDLDVAE